MRLHYEFGCRQLNQHGEELCGDSVVFSVQPDFLTLVLADGLGYAVRTYAPDILIDIATLTGAETVALGDDTAGLVTGDAALARALLGASATTGEPLWRMPLTDYHRELVRSEVADVRNSIELPLAGMLTASAFLETFVDGARWAHLDIAGPAYTTLNTRRYQPAYQNPGATAFGVRLLTRYLLDGFGRGR